MKILMLVNWKVKYCNEIPKDKQPPDYYVKTQPYWFFKYFKNIPEVDVVDVSSFTWLENFEHYKIRFYIWQALRILFKLNRYDLILSHGMQSGVVVSLWRRFFKSSAKHIVVDIGSFNSAAETGLALRLMQYSSKSIDGLIYHTGSQINYYKKYFPWLVKKSKFIRFGTDLDFFDPEKLKKSEDNEKYILCVGAGKRDWDTLIAAYQECKTDIKLRLIGAVHEKYQGIKKVEQIPHVPIRELINQIYNSKFCVLPLQVFNYSYGQMTLMQQMALGKCVLAARVPSLVDYVEDGENVMFYNPEDIEDCRNKLKILLDKDKLRESIADNGVKHLKQNCNEKIMAKHFEDFIHCVLNRRGKL